MRGRAFHRSNTAPLALGQYAPAPYGAQSPYGYPTSAPLDPKLEIALSTLSSVLSKDDPGAPLSIRLIHDVIAAPGTTLFSGSQQPGQQKVAKLSDLNPLLSTIRDVRYSPVLSTMVEHPYISALVFLGGAFMLGRLVGKRSVAAPA